jgi:hypothetical protein
MPARKRARTSRTTPYRRRSYASKTYPKSDFFARYVPRTQESFNEYGASYSAASPQQKMNRARDNMVGRGKFRLGRFVRNQLGRQGARSLGDSAKALLGAGTGLAVGAMTGMGNGQGMYSGHGRALAGSGDYDLGTGAPIDNDSAALEMGQYFYKPHFQVDSIDHDESGLVISNQEFVQNVYGNADGTAFASETFAVNPGLAEVFPMLSQFAINFERYEMVQCGFHFETQLDAGIIQSSTGQVGDILMYSHSDPSAPDLQNVSEFQMNGGVSSRVTRGLINGVECDPGELRGLSNSGINYVRNTPKDDLNEYDQAKFQLAVSNTPVDLAGQVIGKLYVSYTVRLIKPRIMAMLSRNVLRDEHVFADSINCFGNHAPPIAIAGDTDSYKPVSTNNIGALVTSYATSSGVGYLWVTLPAWLQGLIRVTIVSRREGDVASDPNGWEEATSSDGRMIADVKYSDQITVVPYNTYTADNTTLSATSGSDEGVWNGMGVSGQVGGAGDGYHQFAHYTGTFRVAPALTTDNIIKFQCSKTISACSTNTLGMRTSVVVEVMNDRMGVGGQGITTLAKI